MDPNSAYKIRKEKELNELLNRNPVIVGPVCGVTSSSSNPEPDDSIKYKYIVFSQQRLHYHSQDEVLFKVFEDLTEAREYALEQAMDKLRFTYRVYRLVPEHAYWMESVFYSYPQEDK